MFIIIKMEEVVTLTTNELLRENELLPIITKVIFVYLNKYFSKDF